MNRPRLRADCHVAMPSPETTIVSDDGAGWFINDPLQIRIIGHLAGGVDLGKLLDDLSDSFFPPLTLMALQGLERIGLVVDGAGDGAAQPSELAFWDHLGVGRTAALTRLSETRVEVTTAGTGKDAVDPTPIADALVEAGLHLADKPDQASLTAVVTGSYLDPALAQINDLALASGRRWTLVRPVGTVLLVGPVFRPGETACWACLARRLRQNQHGHRFLEAHPDTTVLTGSPRAAAGAATAALAGGLLAAILLPWITGGRATSADRVTRYDVARGRRTTHPLPRFADCPCSGALPPPAPTPVVLVSRPKQGRALGGQSTRSTEEALAAYDELVDPLTGIVTALREKPEQAPFHAVQAVHPFPARGDAADLRQTLFGRSGGVGETEDEARLAAIGEAAERVSGIWRDTDPCRRASRDALGNEALDLAACQLFSDAQIAGRDTWNAVHAHGFDWVPARLDPAREIDWTAVTRLSDGAIRYLPSSSCYYGHPDQRLGFAACDSNGCASGNTLEEAVRAALFELIERDAVGIWWYNRIVRPGVALDSFELPIVQTLARFIDRCGRDLTAIDVGGDFGVPVFAAVSSRLGDADPKDVVFGFGAHLDAGRALKAALLEMLQMHAVVAGRVDGKTDGYRTLNPDMIAWCRTATRETEPYLSPDLARPAYAATDYPMHWTADVRDDIALCLEALGRAGLEVYALDQTRSDIGVPTCRVIVPGLRHFWRRLAPGRLYDVPVARGERSAPTLEADTNPAAIPF